MSDTQAPIASPLARALTMLAPQPEQVLEVPLAQLHDSPLQYRQTYRDATIAEIAASIRDTGRIQQPLVVRLRYPNPLFRDQYDTQDGYEIVFGHTRRRGAELAGLTSAPCIVRNMTDTQVRAAQAAENIARADVHPIEEAQGFRAMIDNDNTTADLLAAQLGKSRSYVYGRLKLLQLCPEVRRAVLAGEVGTEVGLLIARVGDAKLQAKALGYIKAKYISLEDGGAKSFRQIRDLLNERFTLSLKEAIFDVEDEMLLPAAGHCLRCPKRSGNAPEFADVVADDTSERWRGMRHAGPDVCTDPDCYDAKRKAHLAREAAKLTAAGKVVVTGNAARAALGVGGTVKGAYVDADRVAKALKAAAKGKAANVALQPVLVQDQRTGKTVKAYKQADLVAAGLAQAAAPAPKGGDNYNSPAAKAARAEQAAKDEAKVADENARRLQMLVDVRAVIAAAPRTAFDLRMVANVALRGVNWSDRPLLAKLWDLKNENGLDELPDTLDLDAVTRFVLDCALVGNVHIRHVYDMTDVPTDLLAACKHYGIDTPSTAGAGAKKAAAGAGAKQRTSAAWPAADEDQDDKDTGCAGDQLDNADDSVDGGSDATAGALEGVQ